MGPAGEAAHLGDEPAEIFGHPAGLFTIFFAEMWERFSYYGMRALLVLYMTKGFLGYGDSQAYTVYGAYTALVYMTPFIGGFLADKFLGQRRAVIVGGVLMSLGHLLMTYESDWPFFFALALLITGNGFFKPNISTMVGGMYRPGSPKRDSGFTIFYMGINLGAAISPLLCGYLGETWGWHWGFGLATLGMMVGLAVFVMPNLITQLLIGLAAVATAGGLLWFRPDNPWAIGINILVAVALLAAGIIACVALSRGGIPKSVGTPPDDVVKAGVWPAVLGGILIVIPIFALLVSGFAPFNNNESFQLIPEEQIESVAASGTVGKLASVLLAEVSKPAGLVLSVIGLIAFGYLLVETFRLNKIWRHRMIVALVLIFFQMLFFAFFEQAGSSINNFTDRNVDRVTADTVVTADQVGETIQLQPTQEQLGYKRDGEVFTMTDLNDLRKEAADADFTIDWKVTEDNVGMGVTSRKDELAASSFQALNAIFILVFGLPLAFLWTRLAIIGKDPSAPLKFGLGLIQLGLGFYALYLGAASADSRGMVAVGWLALGYLLHTTGELCLSPVGLSQMTKLSPKHLVSTVMGGWFLATAFSQYLAAIISQFTGVSAEGGSKSDIPPPIDSVGVYGEVFFGIAIAAVVSGVICAVLTPLLKAWMHPDIEPDDPRMSES
ncbi:MAG: peptide MFS transporter [Planctomycetota bacterium]